MSNSFMLRWALAPRRTPSLGVDAQRRVNRFKMKGSEVMRPETFLGTPPGDMGGTEQERHRLFLALANQR
jgi:hypothetical protein